MTIIMIGSGALNHRIPAFRNPVDIDVLINMADIKGFLTRFDTIVECLPRNSKKFHAIALKNNKKIHVEMELIDTSETGQMLADYVLQDKDTDIIDGIHYPSLNFLYMLKMSHRFLRNHVHFWKTRDDILRMRDAGAVITDNMIPVYKAREKSTYYYKKFSLNTSKEDFFVDNVPYTYDHDSIHVAMARGSRPAYFEFQEPGSEVMCSRSLFEELPHDIKLNAVIEESCVLALERAVIPHGSDPYQSYMKALRAVCTGTTGGWFRQFAWDYAHEARDAYDLSYVEKFDTALNDGVIKPYRKNELQISTNMI